MEIGGKRHAPFALLLVKDLVTIIQVASSAVRRLHHFTHILTC